MQLIPVLKTVEEEGQLPTKVLGAAGAAGAASLGGFPTQQTGSEMACMPHFHTVGPFSSGSRPPERRAQTANYRIFNFGHGSCSITSRWQVTFTEDSLKNKCLEESIYGTDSYIRTFSMIKMECSIVHVKLGEK